MTILTTTNPGKTMKKTTQYHPLTRRTALLAIAGSVAHLAGCGGGSDIAAISSGGTGSFTNGAISGLGSIIVNGIRYDDSSASVSGAVQSASALRPGMVVTIKGSAVAAATSAGGLRTATASSIVSASEWKGQVGAIGADSFTLLGMTVQIKPATLFEGDSLSPLTGLAGPNPLLADHFVEVYGFIDPISGHLAATRVERKSGLADLGNEYRVSGVVQAKTSGDFTLKGSRAAPFAYDNTTKQPQAWSAGMLVRVRLDTSFQATRVEPAAAGATEGIKDDQTFELEGYVTALAANSLAVNGVEIVIPTGRSFSGLTVGKRVEVKGTTAAGQLIAATVEVEGESSSYEGSDGKYEFHGTVSALLLDMGSGGSFTLKGTAFTYNSTTAVSSKLGWSTTGTPYLDKVSVKASASNGVWLASKIDKED
jgi:hypothetical protein